MTTKPRLIGYLRCSTDKQAEEGLTLDSQRARIEAYCTAMNFELVDVIADEGVSGAVPPAERKGFSRILKALKSGEAEGVIAVKLDRFSRSTRDALALVEAAETGGWRIVSVCESLDTKSASGRLVVTILSAFAEFERGVIGERTRDGMAQLKREGKRRSGRAPWGQRFEPCGEPVWNPKIKKFTVPMIIQEEPFEKYLSGIIQMLHKNGNSARYITTAIHVNPRTLKRFTESEIYSILRSARNQQK